jgi:hypothetical protein
LRLRQRLFLFAGQSLCLGHQPQQFLIGQPAGELQRQAPIRAVIFQLRLLWRAVESGQPDHLFRPFPGKSEVQRRLIGRIVGHRKPGLFYQQLYRVDG